MTQPSSGILTSQSQKNPATEFFKGAMRDCRIKLTPGDDPNVLEQEQALVVRDLDKLLEENDDCVDKFLRGFRVLIKKEKYLKKALHPTKFKKENAESDVEIQQESLFRIFLKVNRLQSEIVEILLDELTESVSEDNQDTAQLRLLLGQLRFLPHIKDPESLTTKLLDIIDVASYPSQLAILDSIPEILPDSEYDETAKKLGLMLEINDELSSGIIDCLNALNVGPEIRAQVQDHALAKILTGSCVKTFPVLLDFLLTDVNSRTLAATLVKIRNALDVVMGSEDADDEDKQSTKIVIFQRLEKAAMSKTIVDGWLGVISNVKNPNDHRAADLLVLFALHAHAQLKKRTVETVFRKKVKEGLFKCSLLENLFEKYLSKQLVDDYFATIVEIGAGLLRTSTESAVTDFAGALFSLLFNHKHTRTTYKQDIIENLIQLVGSSNQRNVTKILNIFVDLVPEIRKTPNHALILMRLLEKLDDFDLKDVKIVFEILCSLICREESLLGLKEELHMIVRKQLSSCKRIVKLRGLIAAVVMAKHVAHVDHQEEATIDSEDSILTINQLKGAAKEAAAILELANTSTVGNCDLVAMYYDQLAVMLRRAKNLDKNFMAWLFETITNDFQTIFVTETVCEDVDDLQFSIQYNLNTTEEMDTPLAVNIAELTLKTNKILVLAPHFRLLRLMHHHQNNGDLSSIDALLGCGVILPNTDQRDSLDEPQLKQMANCLFHCINWFREVISAFVTQKNKKLRYKVLQRLDNIIQLEQLLDECLDNIPGHRLPSSYFEESPVKESPVKGKPPRKKLKSKETIDESTTTAPSTSKPRKLSSEDRKVSFREIDVDAILLIKYPLDMDEMPPGSDRNCLNVDQLVFLLRDFTAKLSSLTTGRDLGLSDLTVVPADDLMKDCVNILPNIHKHFAVICQKLDESAAFGLILSCLALIFGWSGFQHSKRLDLLRDILKAFRPQDAQSPISVNRLVFELAERLIGHADRCRHLEHAVALITILQKLHSLAPGSSLKSKIAKTAEKLLNIEWDKSTSGDIDHLVGCYLSDATTKTLCRVVGTLQDQAGTLQNKTDLLPMLKTIHKANFFVLYRNLWGTLHERVKTEIQALTNAQHLTLWRTTALTMQGLMAVARAQETRNNLVCFLKKSIAILKVFLTHGVPILEIELKRQPDQVVEILKTIQTNTRFLHHLCCYSKLTKDASLMSHVPQFRLTLESLVYRVKAALVANNCSAAFWMGNLKNRDLQGEDILSQSTRNEEEEEEEDVDMSDDSDDGTNKSGSEVFD